MRQKRIFTIPPGAPFLRTFAGALLDGQIVDGYSKDLGPLETADATIYVPTRRSAAALARELAAQLGRDSVLLPRILPLGALEETETSLLPEEGALETDEFALPPAIGEIPRRLLLSELILRWSRALRHAIVSIDARGRREVDEREACLVGTTAADAWHLSHDLAGLVDELIIEDIAWKKLDPLVLPEFDPYWRITLDFLDIAMRQWPAILAERTLVDKARRQMALVAAQARRLCDGHLSGPVVAIGSTGSNKATARLLAAIAAAPRGAVVLPGLDLGLDSRAFALVSGDGEKELEPSFTHPQAMLARLLPVLGVTRDDIVSLGSVPVHLAARERFVSEALRPAETTDAWLDLPGKLDGAALAAGLERITSIEAADEREEALALAIALREVLAAPGATAALVTPDRGLARRVRGELLRWGIEIDDSAGEPLSATPWGVLARLVIACAGSGNGALNLAALLAHPLARLGLSRDDLCHRAAHLEIGLLRAACSGGLTARTLLARTELLASARAEAEDRRAHPAKQRLTSKDWARLGNLTERLRRALSPILSSAGEQGLAAWVAAHREALALVAEPAAARSEDCSALEALLDELSAGESGSLRLDAESYGHFFTSVAREVALGETRIHPRLAILGLLEARLVSADVMLLGGLDETVWPPQAETDAFLNRPMRAALGLSPPERRLGQTAHDFWMALGHERVILSRARKRDGAPTVASRLVQRMAALGGDAFRACTLRGDRYIELARAIDRPAASSLIGRPLPRPKLELRPTSFSVTRIETLRRDPYAIYAEYILGLAPLDPLGAAPGLAELGTAMHNALELFVAKFPAGPLPETARQVLCALLEHGLRAHLDDPDFAAVQWPRLQKTIDFYLGFEAGRRGGIIRIATEVSGALEIPLADGSMFTLSARADRIESHADGTVTLVDYKTGTPPGQKEIEVGFAPQLTLEGAMVLRGAFGCDWKPTALEGLYLKLGGKGGGEEKPVRFKDESAFSEVAERHYRELVALLDQYRDASTPYPPRPFPKFAKRHNAYDHLARIMEWSQGADENGGGE